MLEQEIYMQYLMMIYANEQEMAAMDGGAQ